MRQLWPAVSRWKAVEKCGVPHDFVELALQLLSAHASSASTKRIFSSFGGIHTKIHTGNQKTAIEQIQLYVCERFESLLWLLNKIYLQVISVIIELEKM